MEQRQFTLIDASGRTYITPTDRRVLKAMIATESIRACSARKQYAIRGENGELDRAVTILEATAQRANTLPGEREACRKMLQRIRSFEDAGDGCLVLLSWNKGDLNPKNTNKQLFFLS